MFKKVVSIISATLMLLAMCACGGTAQQDPGVGDLAWGESPEKLFKGEGAAEYEVVDMFAEYAGCAATLHYRFDENTGGLYSAYYEFNADGTADPIAIYKTLLSAMEAEYGKRSEMVVNDSDGNPIPAPTIEDVEQSGELSCIDSWSGLPAPEGARVNANLQLYPGGVITLSFICI